MPILNNIANAFLGAMQVSAIYRGAEKIWPSFTGLLDLYPNAAVAYSLRRLRSGYTGSAIRVRRSSDSAEQDIGFVSNVLDTASLLTFVGAGDGFVTTWYDQSGLGFNATQTSALVQPEIVLGGVLWTQNGKPAVRFLDDTGTAVLDRLNVPLFHTANQSYVGYFWSYAMRVNGNFPILLNTSTGAGGFRSFHDSAIRVPRQVAQRSVIIAGDSSIAINLNQTYIRTDTANRVNVKTFINNVQTMNIADSNTDFILPPNYTLGGSGATTVIQNDNLIQEFVAYTYDVDASISAINGNLNAFYGAY
jgi:hypothetical protein